MIKEYKEEGEVEGEEEEEESLRMHKKLTVGVIAMDVHGRVSACGIICNVILLYDMLCYLMLHYDMICYVILCYIMIWYVCYIMFC